MGPRIGRFEKDGTAKDIKGHSVPVSELVELETFLVCRPRWIHPHVRLFGLQRRLGCYNIQSWRWAHDRTGYVLLMGVNL